MLWSRATCMMQTDLGDSPGGGHMVRWHRRRQSHFHCWGSYSASCLQQEKQNNLIDLFVTQSKKCYFYYFLVKPFLLVQGHARTHFSLNSYIANFNRGQIWVSCLIPKKWNIPNVYYVVWSNEIKMFSNPKVILVTLFFGQQSSLAT